AYPWLGVLRKAESARPCRRHIGRVPRDRPCDTHPLTDEPVVLYGEEDGVAFVTINRPDKKNTINDEVIQLIADSVDRAAASAAVSAVVLRVAWGVLCACYALTSSAAWRPVFDGPSAGRDGSRPGAWDPVRDWQF